MCNAALTHVEIPWPRDATELNNDVMIKFVDVHYQQESLANAKVSARQPWYIGRNSLNWPPLRIAQQYQRNLYIVEKYFLCATIPSLTMWVYLHSFSRCCLPNMPTIAKSGKIWTPSSSRSSKVDDFGTNRQRIYEFLLVINSNFILFCTVSGIRRLIGWKLRIFHTPSYSVPPLPVPFGISRWS